LAAGNAASAEGPPGAAWIGTSGNSGGPSFDRVKPNANSNPINTLNPVIVKAFMQHLRFN
jgi:hypothetical protein